MHLGTSYTDAGNIMKGSGFGVVDNIIVEIVGVVLEDFVFSLLDITAGELAGSLIIATVGVIIFLY